ncbi:hypothetical protein [Sphingobium yanoikuyae]
MVMMTKKTIPFGIGNIASDNSLALLYFDCLAKDHSPSIAAAAADLKRQLVEFSVNLLAFKATNGDCEQHIPIVDEEVELYNAKDRLSKISHSIESNNIYGPISHNISEHDVKDLGLF